jgi:glutamyl-tRNA reductase
MELRKKGKTHQLLQSVIRMALHFAKVVVTRTAIEA